MNIKKLLYGSLFAGGVLAVTRLLFAKTGSIKPVSNENSHEAIDTYVQEQLHRLHIPGASLAVIESDKIVHLRGFGQARPGGETPTPHTPFFIGSLTKSITALAVMQLVEARKVELDAPVQRYLPWFRVVNPEASAQMTVRHLLNQTSGMPLMASEIVMADFNDSLDATERQVRALSTLKISRPVGSKCEYSNFNYNILGLIIEATSGEAYPDYIRKHIFVPLDMHHSYTSKQVAQEHSLAVGHRHWFGLPFPVPNWPVPRSSLPAGQLISCTEDMAHYLIAHLNGGRYGATQILSSHGIDEMHRGVMELKLGELSGGLYGMGWFEIDLGQVKIYSHGGNVPDFSAFMALIPGQKKGIVLLLNADPYGLPMITEEIGEGATALLAGQQPAPIKLDFIQWVIRLLPLVPLLQVVGALATLRTLHRWAQKPDLRPGIGRVWGQHILLPLIPNLSLSALLVYLQSSGVIKFLQLFMPDLALIAKISGGFATIWTFLRIGLLFTTLRKPRHRIPL